MATIITIGDIHIGKANHSAMEYYTNELSHFIEELKVTCDHLDFTLIS